MKAEVTGVSAKLEEAMPLTEQQKFDQHREAYNERFEPTDDEGKPTGEVPIPAQVIPPEVHLGVNEEMALKVRGAVQAQPYATEEEEVAALAKATLDAQERARVLEKARERSLHLCKVSGHAWRMDVGASLTEIHCARCKTLGVIVSEQDAFTLHQCAPGEPRG